MTVYILFFIFHVIIYGPRVCNKHLNKQTIIMQVTLIVTDFCFTKIQPLKQFPYNASVMYYVWNLLQYSPSY